MNQFLTEIIEKQIIEMHTELSLSKDMKNADFNRIRNMSERESEVIQMTDVILVNFFTQLKDMYRMITFQPGEINREWSIVVTGDLLRWLETSLGFKPNHTPTTQRLMRGDMGYSAASISIAGFDVVQLVDRIKAYAEAQLKHRAEEQAKKDQATVNKLILEHLPKLMECMSNQEQRLSEMQKAHGEEMMALRMTLDSLGKQNTALQDKLNSLTKHPKR